MTPLAVGPSSLYHFTISLHYFLQHLLSEED